MTVKLVQNGQKMLELSPKMKKVLFWLRVPIMLLSTEISLFGEDNLLLKAPAKTNFSYHLQGELKIVCKL